MKTFRHLIVLLALPAAVLAQSPDTDAPEIKPPADDDPTRIDGTSPGGLPDINIDLVTPEAKAARERFDKLPEEERAKFARLMNEAQALLAQRRVQEALEKLTDAEQIWSEHPNVLNLKGAALVNIRDFERASEYFSKATKLYPGFWQAKFNYAEMNFVRMKFPRAEEQFRNLLEESGDDLEATTRRLIDYKIIICLLKQGKGPEAEELTKNYDIFDDSPVYYYAMAAAHFEKGEKDKAEEWVRNARRIYPKQTNAIFEDALVEMGWLFVF